MTMKDQIDGSVFRPFNFKFFFQIVQIGCRICGCTDLDGEEEGGEEEEQDFHGGRGDSVVCYLLSVICCLLSVVCYLLSGDLVVFVNEVERS